MCSSDLRVSFSPQELERELELQVGLKQEMEVAMGLLEKDTHDKQDALAALRIQLDQVKTLNLQMFHKAQVRTLPTRTPTRMRTHTPRFRLLRMCSFAGRGERHREQAGGRGSAGGQDEAHGDRHAGDGAEVGFFYILSSYILNVFLKGVRVLVRTWAG